MKRPLIAAAVLLLAAGSALAAGPVELRIFDVSKIVRPRRAQFSERLGPPNLQQDVEECPDTETEPLIEGDAFVDLIRETVDPESWGEEERAEIHYRYPGTLIVRHLPEVLRKIEMVIADYQAAASRRVHLDVDLYELPPARYEEMAGGADPAAAGAEAKLVSSASAEAWPGLPRVVRITDRVRYVAEYDVEIAQGSALGDPMVIHADEGLSVSLTASPTLDGSRVLLDTTLESGRFQRPFRSVELGVDEEYLPEPFRSARRYLHGRIDLPVYEEADCFTTHIVRSGGAATIPLLRDGRLFVLRVRPTVLGRGGPPGLLDVGALTSSPYESWLGFPGEYDEDAVGRIAPGFHLAEEPVNPPLGGIEEILELLVSNISPEAWESYENRMGVTGPSRLVVVAPEKIRSDLVSFLTDREQRFLRPVALDLRVYSVADEVASGEGKEPAAANAWLRYAAALSAMPNRRTGVQAGSRAAFLADYDVEVAQESRIADPIVGLSFDGIVGNLRPVLGHDRTRMALDVELLLARRGPFGRYDSGTQYLGPIDQFDTARTILNQTIEMPANGVYTIDAGPDPRDPGRRLAVVIRSSAK